MSELGAASNLAALAIPNNPGVTRLVKTGKWEVSYRQLQKKLQAPRSANLMTTRAGDVAEYSSSSSRHANMTAEELKARFPNTAANTAWR
jgi:hypothetical protein